MFFKCLPPKKSLYEHCCSQNMPHFKRTTTLMSTNNMTNITTANNERQRSNQYSNYRIFVKKITSLFNDPSTKEYFFNFKHIELFYTRQ